MIIELPLNWKVGKKNETLSMNNYRNWHYHVSSKLKRTVSDYLLRYKFPKFNKVKLVYTLWFKDKRNRDIMNFVSVADKFILDHLVQIGSLKDDNYKYVKEYSIKYGGKKEKNYIKLEIIEIGG